MTVDVDVDAGGGVEVAAVGVSVLMAIDVAVGVAGLVEVDEAEKVEVRVKGKVGLVVLTRVSVAGMGVAVGGIGEGLGVRVAILGTYRIEPARMTVSFIQFASCNSGTLTLNWLLNLKRVSFGWTVYRAQLRGAPQRVAVTVTVSVSVDLVVVSVILGRMALGSRRVVPDINAGLSKQFPSIIRREDTFRSLASSSRVSPGCTV